MKHKSTIPLMLIILTLVMLVKTIQPVSALTWAPSENRLTTDPYADNAPTITETSDQKIWVIWQKRVLLGTSLFYRTSSNQGATWSEETNITEVPATYADTGPCMIQLSNGTLFLVWSSSRTGDYELFYKTSTNLGATWSNTIQLTFSLGDDLRPSVIQLSNGTLFLVWSSSRTGDYELFYKTYSGFWPFEDNQLTFNTAQDQGPSATQTKDGKIWVTWSSFRTDNREIYYKTYDGTWSSETNLSQISNREDSSPSIMQTHDQTIYVFWCSDPPTPTGTNDIYYKYSTNNGASWSSPTQLTTDPYEDLWPSAKQARNHRVWVVWTSNRADQVDGNFDVYYRTTTIHNLAVTEVTSQPSTVFRGENVSISVAIHNQGDYAETFTLTCYANSSIIHTRIISLNQRASTVISFQWNTSSFTSGKYTVKASTNIVTGETYTDDNTKVDGIVHVRLLGDLDNNGTVDGYDLSALNATYGSTPSSINWNQYADMNRDSKIDARDLKIVGDEWGKTG
jgi:hypothetical protein